MKNTNSEFDKKINSVTKTSIDSINCPDYLIELTLKRINESKNHPATISAIPSVESVGNKNNRRQKLIITWSAVSAAVILIGSSILFTEIDKPSAKATPSLVSVSSSTSLSTSCALTSQSGTEDILFGADGSSFVDGSKEPHSQEGDSRQAIDFNNYYSARGRSGSYYQTVIQNELNEHPSNTSGIKQA